jgi:DNA binding domain, excisionase family
MTTESTIKDVADKSCIMVDKIYTVDETADLLKIKPRTVREWIRTGKLKSFKIGGLVRVHDDDLQAFIDRSRKGTGKK